MSVPLYWYIMPIGAVLSLLVALVLFIKVKNKDAGTEDMQRIAGYVREGAFAYLRQQFKIVGLFFLVAFAFLNFMAWYLGVLHPLVPWSFLTGGIFSAIAGHVGMNIATLASNRTSQAARTSLNGSLKIAFRAGGVMGIGLVGLALLGISLWFFILYANGLALESIVFVLLGYVVGASSQALFARLGGGIYTKAADVGADLVGKIEAGIPEDDARNPATIADNVGDCVGDTAGMGADLFESYVGSIIATSALGLAAIKQMPDLADFSLNFMIAPMVLAGLGAILSILGLYLASTKEDANMKQLMFALNKGVYVSAILIAIGAYFITRIMLPGEYAMGIFLAGIIGLVVGILIGSSTEVYTSNDFKATQGIAKQGEYGSATLIIEGFAVGLKSAGAPVLIIVIGILSAFCVSKGFVHPEMGLYGIGFGAVGMLATLGVTLSMDAFGPIADNAGGNAQMANLPKEVRERTDALDALGNTTAATGKGFAIGSAALTALALLAAYVEQIRTGLLLNQAKELHIEFAGEIVRIVEVSQATISDFVAYYGIHLMNPRLIGGILIGGMITFVFASLALKAVSKAAGSMVQEVRRQFKEIPGILEGKSIPDYARCVHIATIGAQKEMVLPALLGILTPIVIGLCLGVAGVIGLLVGGLSTGFVLAVMMNNSGAAWDNAKKYIEKGFVGGKNSEAHSASVTGDTVGDPFKDTAGPSINILIKLMSTISIIFAGAIIAYSPMIIGLYAGQNRSHIVYEEEITTEETLLESYQEDE